MRHLDLWTVKVKCTTMLPDKKQILIDMEKNLRKLRLEIQSELGGFERIFIIICVPFFQKQLISLGKHCHTCAMFMIKRAQQDVVNVMRSGSLPLNIIYNYRYRSNGKSVTRSKSCCSVFFISINERSSINISIHLPTASSGT